MKQQTSSDNANESSSQAISEPTSNVEPEFDRCKHPKNFRKSWLRVQWNTISVPEYKAVSADLAH